MNRRVVIVGMGALAPAGNSVGELWANLLAGCSGIGPITRFDASAFPVRIAGELKGFDPLAFLDRKDQKKMDPFIHYAMATGQMAMEDAGLRLTPQGATRFGVVVGSSRGGIVSLEQAWQGLQQRGPRGVSPFLTPMSLIHMAAGFLALRLGIKGPTLGIATACASGTHALGEAFRLIKAGHADLMLAVGTEAPLCPTMLAGFAAARALSRRNEAPQAASRPFDAARDGFVLAEGAGLLVLEEMHHALDRDASIYAEIAGYGTSTDAYHYTLPDPEGRGAVRAMQMALEEAGLAPGDIGYVNAHGTSSRENDRMEAKALHRVFGDRVSTVPVSATKSMTGHMLGATGAVEALITALVLQRGMIPPTINHDHPDPECPLDVVSNRMRRTRAHAALTASYGFGGVNACLALRRWGE